MSSSSRFLRAATRKDLRRRLADPAALAIWLGIPLVLGGLMSLAFGGRNAPTPKAHVLWVDLDGSRVSALLLQLAGASRMREFLEVEPVSEEDGSRRIAAGDATAMLVLPRGLQDAILNERPATLALVTNPSQRILPAIVEEGLDILVESTFYAQQLFGDLLRDVVTGPSPGESLLSDARVAELSTRINARLRTLQPVLLPPALSLEFAEASSRADGASFGMLFLPGVVLMSVLFIAQGMGGDIWEEEEAGTLRRIKSSPQPLALWLAAKILAGACLMAVAAAAAVAIAALLFDVAPGRAPAAIAWATFAGAALLVYFMLLQTLATSARGANLLSSLIVFPLMMIGGSFFPFESMPAWMAAVGRWTPNGLAVVRLKELLFGSPQLSILALSAAAIGVPAVLAFLYTAGRLERRFGAR